MRSQELYPNSEPASIIPKNVLGIRLMNEGYISNSNNIKNWNGTMLMYGLNSKLMFNATLTASNHHARQLPNHFIQKDSNNVGYVNSSPSVIPYDYLFESVNVGFRYRFLNKDGDHKHFRMALYANGAYAHLPHDEAEVSLSGDNKAVGGGIISTILIKKLAVSFTGGAIVPFSYKEKNRGIEIHYGNAYNYSLSLGYLVYPFKYSNFKQTNINFYAEFLGKNYNALSIIHNNEEVSHQNEKFNKGNYIELRPAIQFIVKSNLRIDCSTSLPILNKSYTREYPLYLLNIQYYFFL